MGDIVVYRLKYLGGTIYKIIVKDLCAFILYYSTPTTYFFFTKVLKSFLDIFQSR